MKLYDKVKLRHEEHLNGKQNYLPLPDLGKLTKWFPGFMRHDLTCLTGTPSSGKTALCKYLVINEGVRWAVKNKKDFHVLYMGLEETEEEFDYSLLSHQLYKSEGLRYNIRNFENVGQGMLPEDIEKIKSVEHRIETIKSYVIYEDAIFNTFGIYKRIRQFARERGDFYLGGVKLTNQSLIENKSMWDGYVPHNPEEIVVVVVDHCLDLAVQQDEKDISGAIQNLVITMKHYVAKMFGYSVVIVQHQDNSVDSFDRRQAKDILCSIPNLARNKEVARQYKNILGLTNVNVTNTTGSNGIEIWDGYRVPLLGNFSRVVNVIKNRYGEKDVNSLLYFDGCVGEFSKLPKSESQEFKDLVTKVKTY